MGGGETQAVFSSFVVFRAVKWRTGLVLDRHLPAVPSPCVEWVIQGAFCDDRDSLWIWHMCGWIAKDEWRDRDKKKFKTNGTILQTKYQPAPFRALAACTLRLEKC